MFFDDLSVNEKDQIISECEALIDNGLRHEIFSKYPEYSARIIEQIEGFQWSRGKSFALAKNGEGNWFESNQTHQRWRTYENYLLDNDKTSEEDWEEITKIIDETTSRALNYLENPVVDIFQRKVKGVVVGHVQSGKTANFTGLLAKAADTGYNVLIVLAGITNILRNQTQKRLLKDLSINGAIQIHPTDNYRITIDQKWIPLTQEDTEDRGKLISRDFGGTPYDTASLPYGGDFNRLLTQKKPMLAIVKKRAERLEHLTLWLRQCPESLKSQLKILIIDDEADAASINNQTTNQLTRARAAEAKAREEREKDPVLMAAYQEKKRKEEEARLKRKARDKDPNDVDDEEATFINRRIRTILHKLPNTAYVGYTATPYASLLSDPCDNQSDIGRSLYPRDFVMTLPKPDNHDGTFEFFDEEGLLRRHVAIVTEREAKASRRPPRLSGDTDHDLPEQLKLSVEDFFITGAIKEMRGHDNFHHSMLVHTSINTLPHNSLKTRIRNFCTLLRSEYLADDWGNRTEIYHRFKRRWEAEFSISPSAEPEMDSAMMSLLNDFRPQTMVRRINSVPPESDELIQTKNRLDYDDVPGGLKVIAVGGTILSRGLTVEGLTISYFTRETALYDSLTQMSRWCGFHKNWRDLIRVRTTAKIREWFEWIHEVESSLRRDIERYDGDPDLSPMNLAPRILKHVKTCPDMRTMDPTRKSAMGTAEEYHGGLNGTYHQTFRFHLDDRQKLEENIELMKKMVEGIQGSEAAFRRIERGARDSMLWTQVPFNLIHTFLSSYNSPVDDTGFQYEAEIGPYIERRGDELQHWRVALINNSMPRLEPEPILAEVGIEQPIGFIERGRKANGRIDQLISKNHTAIDLEEYPDAYRRGDVRKIAMMDRLENQPLLLIYILHKNARPNATDNTNYVDLFEGISEPERAHVIGLGMALPDSSSVTQYEMRAYYHARGVSPD